MSKYLVRLTRQFFAGTIGANRFDYIDSDGVPTHIKSWQYVKPFASRSEAVEWIKAAEAETYLMSNGECGHPTYTAVHESKWPEYINA